MRHVPRGLLILLFVNLGVGCAMMSQADERYVKSVGMRMAEQAGRPQLPWQFHVLNSNQVNAFASYGRSQEHDADLAGLKYMSAAGYNPKAMVTVMETLKHASAGKSKSPQFLSTHPDPGNREEYLTEAIRKNYPIQA